MKLYKNYEQNLESNKKNTESKKPKNDKIMIKPLKLSTSIYKMWKTKTYNFNKDWTQNQKVNKSSRISLLKEKSLSNL
jgi:hypothetical protein